MSAYGSRSRLDLSEVSGAGESMSMAALVRRIDSLERDRARYEGSRQGLERALAEERNSRVTLEDDVDQLRGSSGRKHTDEQIQALRREIQDDMTRWQEEMVLEIETELVEFRKVAIVPLQVDLRDKLDNVVVPLKAKVDRTTLDFEQHFAELERNVETGQSQLQAQVNDIQVSSTQLGTQIKEEQADHAEAIGNLMDMLERTATQDDLTQSTDALAQDAEARAQQTAAELARCEDVLQELDERLKAAELGFEEFQAQQAAAIEAKINEVGDELSAGIDAQLHAAADDLDQVDQKLDKACAELTASVSKMERDLQNHVDDLGSRLTATEESTRESAEATQEHGERVLKLGSMVEALDSKVESTSQVLDQKVELTAEEMDRQLAATKVSLETNLAKAARETTDRIDAGDKASLNALAEARQGLSTQLDGLKQKMTEFETGAATQAEKDIRELREKINEDVKEMRTSLNDRTAETTAKVDQKLETSLKQMADQTVASKAAIMDVSERVSGLRTDMEERVGEASTQLAQLRKETVEQQEKDTTSMKQLIEMKERTIMTEQKRETQERVTAVKDIKDKLTQDVSKISSRVDEQHSTYSDMCATQERKFTDKASALDAMIADHHTHFSSLCTAMEQRFNDKATAITARAEDLSNTVNMHHHSLNTLCTNMESKTADRMQHFDKQLESTRANFAETCSKLDNKLAEQKQKTNDALNDRVKKLSDDIQGTRTHLSERQAQDLEHFQQRVQEFEEKMRHKQMSQEARVDGVVSSLQATDNKIGRLDGSLAQLSNSLKDNRDTFNKICTAIEKKIEERSSTHEAAVQDLRGTVTQHYTTFNGLCGDTDAKLKGVASQLTQLAVLGKDQHQNMQDKMHETDTAVKEELRQLKDTTAHLTSQLSDARSDADAKAQSQYSHFTELNTNLDKKLVEKTAALEGRMKDAQQLLSDSMAAVEVQSKQKDTEHDKRFREVTNLVDEKAQETVELCRKLEQQGVDCDARSVDRTAEVADQLRETKRALVEQLNGQEKQAADATRAVDDKLTESSDKLTRDAARLDKKVAKMESLIDERIAALQKGQAEDRDTAHSACTKLDSKLTERLDDLDSRTQTADRVLTSDVAALTKQTADSAREMGKQLTEETASLQDKLTALGDTVGANQQQASIASDEVSEKLKNLEEATEDRITKQRDGLTDMIRLAESTLRTQQDALDTAIQGQHSHFTTLLGEQDQKFSEQGREQGAELVALTTSLQAQNDSFTKVCEGIVEFAKEENAAQDKRVLQTFQGLDDSCAALDQKFSELTQKHDERMDELREAISSVDLKMEEKNAAQDERVDELDDDMKALTQQVAADRTTAVTAARAVSASLADATEDLRVEIGREAKGLGERLDSAVVAWEAGAAEYTARLDAEVRERVSAIEALGLKTETEAGRLDSEHCALKSLVGVELPRLESKIGAEVAGLTVRVEAETAQISRAIDELSLDLSTRLTNGVDSLSTQLDAADTKLSTRITAESKSFASKLENATNSLGSRLSNEASDLRAAVKGQGSRLDTALRECSSSLNTRIDEEVSRLAGEAVDYGRRQEARVVGVEQAVEKAVAESAARIERRLEDGVSELRSKDSQLDANLSKAVNDANAAAHGLGNRIDEANSAASALDMKVERQRLEIAQQIVTESTELGRKVSAVEAAAEAADGALSTRIIQLESDVTGKLMGSVAALEGKMVTELSPLSVATERLSRKLDEVDAQAGRADATAQTCATKLGLQQMEMEMISQSVTTLGDMGAPTDEEFEKLEEEVAAVREDVADISTELSLVSATVDATGSGA